MSNAQFEEAFSPDPYVRELHRRVVRLLNDPSLDRQRKELHVRRIQKVLLAHLAKVQAKTMRLAEKKARREQGTRVEGNHAVANQSQVVARRREFGVVTKEATDLEAVEQPAAKELAANDNHMAGHRVVRNRPVLTLKRA